MDKQCPDYSDILKLLDANGIYYDGSFPLTFVPTSLPGVKIKLLGENKYEIFFNGVMKTNHENPGKLIN